MACKSDNVIYQHLLSACIQCRQRISSWCCHREQLNSDGGGDHWRHTVFLQWTAGPFQVGNLSICWSQLHWRWTSLDPKAYPSTIDTNWNAVGLSPLFETNWLVRLTDRTWWLQTNFPPDLANCQLGNAVWFNQKVPACSRVLLVDRDSGTM